MWNTPSKQRLDFIPRLYTTDNIPTKDKLIYLHFFLGGSDWYVCEYDGKDLFWGFVILNGDFSLAEMGYFSFSELKNLRLYGGIEVDCELDHWQIRPAFEVNKICRAKGWTTELSKS